MVNISHQYKFIYLKNVKVAGSYLAMILTKYCTTKPHIQHIENCYQNSTFMKYDEINTEAGFISSWVYKKTNKILFNKHCNHAHSSIIKEKFPNIFDNYFKFCVVRNPYDRIVSRYYWDIKVNEIPKDMSFTTFLENEAKKKINKMNDDWYYRCTLDNQPVCDFYIRFDNLLSDIKTVFDKLSITEPIIDIDINHNSIKKTTDYRSMFNDYTKDIVTKHCQKEIDYFNWKF